MSDQQAPATSGQGATQTSAALAAQPTIAAPTGTQVTQQPAVPPQAAPAWLANADETTVGYVQNKGWTEPSQVLDGYRNLEKLLGADKAGNAVIIPKGDADPKEWAAVYDKMGRPTGADGYKVAVPPGGDAAVQNQVLAKFHELGLTKAQGESLATWYNGLGSSALTAQEQSKQQAFQADDQAVRTTWGQAYTQNLAQAQQAARGLGLDATMIDKMSEGLGHKATMELLQKIGSKMGEDSFVATGDQQGFSQAVTPGQAKAEIQSLMSDKDFTKAYLGGNTEAKAKMARLHAFAFPEG